MEKIIYVIEIYPKFACSQSGQQVKQPAKWQWAVRDNPSANCPNACVSKKCPKQGRWFPRRRKVTVPKDLDNSAPEMPPQKLSWADYICRNLLPTSDKNADVFQCPETKGLCEELSDVLPSPIKVTKTIELQPIPPPQYMVPRSLLIKRGTCPPRGEQYNTPTEPMSMDDYLIKLPYDEFKAGTENTKLQQSFSTKFTNSNQTDASQASCQLSTDFKNVNCPTPMYTRYQSVNLKSTVQGKQEVSTMMPVKVKENFLSNKENMKPLKMSSAKSFHTSAVDNEFNHRTTSFTTDLQFDCTPNLLSNKVVVDLVDKYVIPHSCLQVCSFHTSSRIPHIQKECNREQVQLLCKKLAARPKLPYRNLYSKCKGVRTPGVRPKPKPCAKPCGPVTCEPETAITSSTNEPCSPFKHNIRNPLFGDHGTKFDYLQPCNPLKPLDFKISPPFVNPYIDLRKAKDCKRERACQARQCAVAKRKEKEIANLPTSALMRRCRPSIACPKDPCIYNKKK